ncbi:hypothetical protein ACA758_03505 [Mycoplasmopsis agassizii]
MKSDILPFSTGIKKEWNLLGRLVGITESAPEVIPSGTVGAIFQST